MADLPADLVRALRRAGTLRAVELETYLRRSELGRLVTAGQLQRLARGLYALPDYQPSEHATLVAVAKRAPDSILCLLTALRVHGLTTQSPSEVWIAIGNKDHAPRLDYPPVRVVRFSKASLGFGVETRQLDGAAVRMTNVPKTIADCFKFRSKVGLDVAIEALREARRERNVSADALWAAAKIDRVANVMRPYMESIA